MRRVCFIVLPLLAGCYTYATIDPATALPGTSVRAHVSGATAEQIEPLLGISNARLVSGRVIDNNGDMLIVEVPAVFRAEVGGSIQTLYQRIAIPRSGLHELETRQLDRVRTTAAAGAIAIIVGGLVVKAVKGSPGQEAQPGGGGADFRIPLAFFFRF
jgi:hypothetical protein